MTSTRLDAQVRKARRLSGAKWTRSGLIVEALNQLAESGRQPSSLQKGFPDLIQDCLDWINRQPRKGRRRFRWAKKRWLALLWATAGGEA